MSELEISEDVVLSVAGMTCGGCATTVERILSRVPGVTAVAVELAPGSAIVTGEASPDALVAALNSAGYGAEIAPPNLSQRTPGT